MGRSDCVPGKVSDLDGVLKEAIAANRPVIVDVPTYPYRKRLSDDSRRRLQSRDDSGRSAGA